jgi:hypothetical protein
MKVDVNGAVTGKKICLRPTKEKIFVSVSALNKTPLFRPHITGSQQKEQLFMSRFHHVFNAQD